MIMTMTHAARRSPLALAILGLLDEEPMHTYRMQQLIKARHKDDVVNVRSRASLYQAIDRLERAGLVAVRSTSRLAGRPERTVYALTDAGRATLVRWLREMLATLAHEFPEFPAAIAHLPLLAPGDALRQLEQRTDALATDVERIENGIALGEAAALPRLFLLELEYALAARRAELAWVRSLVDDLRAGRLTWSAESLAPYLGQPKSPEEVMDGRRTMA
ncbi:MAG: PadR family transcriptional regulator [Thermomicrobiales bacterium]|jgi:DNA-binding PadR family transcriptional regulator|nr:PadR family transcriptional regulator [Thermomicrobiales bacterium]